MKFFPKGRNSDGIVFVIGKSNPHPMNPGRVYCYQLGTVAVIELAVGGLQQMKSVVTKVDRNSPLAKVFKYV